MSSVGRKYFQNYWRHQLRRNYAFVCSLHRRAFAQRVMTMYCPVYTCMAITGPLNRHLTLQWRRNEHNASQITGVSIVHPTVCSKKTSKLRVTRLCGGNSPVTSESPAQRASNAENVSFVNIREKMTALYRHRTLDGVHLFILTSGQLSNSVLYR